MILFLLSIILAIGTIFFILSLSSFLIKNWFFSFIPLFLLYLSLITFTCSCFQSLTQQNFFLIQGLLFICSTVYILFKRKNIWAQWKNLFKLFLNTIITLPIRPLTLVLAGIVIYLIILSGSLRYLTPIRWYDDEIYRAASPMYWIQKQSIFRYPTFVEQKNIFIYTTGILYLWPRLFYTGERTALLLFWAAFPILSLTIFVGGSIITKRATDRLTAVFFFVTAPIVYFYANFTLVQEFWLGIVLLDSLYIFVTLYKNKKQRWTHWTWMGLILGILPQIKPNAGLYCIAMFAFLIIRKIKVLPSVFLGFVLSVVISGYVVIGIQNTLLYGSPIGSSTFRQWHMADISFVQIKTHLLRIPFLLIKIPCYMDESCPPKQNIYMQTLANNVGATHILAYEDRPDYFGSFIYDPSSPDRNFGFGGSIWILLTLIFFIEQVVCIIKRKPTPIRLPLFLITTGIMISFVLIYRWADAWGGPSRQLLSAFALMLLFSPIVFAGVEKFIRIPTVLIVLVLFYIYGIPQVTFSNRIINLWKSGRDDQAIHESKLWSNPFLTISPSFPKPSKLLLIDPFMTPDYPLYFWKPNQNNIVNLFTKFTVNPNIPMTDASIKSAFLNTDYIFIWNNEQLVRHILSAYPSFSIYLTFLYNSKRETIIQTGYVH